jgi:sucrose-6-phosphate hydrolase SacC (GH32 family)
VEDARAALPFPGNEGKLTLRLFIERFVQEVFANDTACASKVIAPLDGDSMLEIRSVGGPAVAKRIHVWPMKTIW